MLKMEIYLPFEGSRGEAYQDA